jgi:extracellular elastinolytic metalloproteinase
VSSTGGVARSVVGRRMRVFAMLIGLVVLSGAVQSGAAGGATAKPHRGGPAARAFVDVRTAGASGAVLRQRATTLAASPSIAVMKLGHQLGLQGAISIDPLTGTPRMVGRLDGFLTGPSAAPAADVALGYVKDHASVFKLSARSMAGLRLVRDYVDVAGTHHLGWAQTLHGIPLFGNGLQASVARDGRLINLTGSPVSDLGDVSTSPSLSAASALAAARSDVGVTRSTRLDSAKLVLFQTLGGTRLGWQTVTMSSPTAYLHVIDAGTGRVLFRMSLTDDANGKVFDYWPGAPLGGTQHTVSFTAPGWLPAFREHRLQGNNTHVYTDVNDDNVPQSSEEVSASSDHSWDFTFQPFATPAGGPPCVPQFMCSWNPDQANSWRANRRQNATQVFFYVNNFHDHLAAAPIGFTAAAGNFQQHNPSGQGLGHDAVQAQPDDGANLDSGLPDGGHVDNANMSTPPDGTPPIMQMYLFHQPNTGNLDPFLASNGGDEADVVYHEYTHGLSNRLVVDANGVSTLNGAQPGAMGEAWSDWYAMDFLNNLGFQPDPQGSGDVLVGRYVSENANLIRTQPMDCAVGAPASRCPGTPDVGSGGYTYGDFGKIIGQPEVHADGEIWGETLWDLRRALGSSLTENLVTRAMELSPAAPSYLDMRNAILQADQVVNGGRAHDTIWKVFAHRGMGYFAASVDGQDTHPVEDFSLPPGPGTPTGSFRGRVTDVQTGAVLPGTRVFFGGHASGFPGADLSDTTNANGRFEIDGIFVGTYHDVVAFADGYDRAVITQTIAAQTAGATTHNFRLVRDWASALKGASVAAFDGPDFTAFGCGPINAIDQQQGVGWGSTSDLSPTGQPTANTPKSIVVQLPAAVDISTFGVDPSNTCGDSPSASTGDFKIETSTDGKTFQVAAQGQFTPADLGKVNTVTPAAGTTAGVKFVRFTMINPQVFQIPGASCPGPFSGCDFMDMSELEVYGSQS